MFAEFPLTSARTNCAPVTPDIFQSGTKFGFRAQRKMSREGIVGARFRKGKCPSPAKLRRQTCHLWHSQLKLCAWALGHLRFCRARSPFLKKPQRQEATRTRTPGWLARLIRVHHLAGKRLGSGVPADPLISIDGRSHDQREVLQLPLQHGDGAA